MSSAVSQLDSLINKIENTSEMAEVKENNEGIYAFSEIDIDGNKVSMSKYKNKLLLICNVASK